MFSKAWNFVTGTLETALALAFFAGGMCAVICVLGGIMWTIAELL